MTYKEQAEEIVRKHITCINGGHGLLNPPDWVIKQSVNHAILQVESNIELLGNPHDIFGDVDSEDEILFKVSEVLKENYDNLQSILTELKNML